MPFFFYSSFLLSLKFSNPNINSKNTITLTINNTIFIGFWVYKLKRAIKALGCHKIIKPIITANTTDTRTAAAAQSFAKRAVSFFFIVAVSNALSMAVLKNYAEITIPFARSIIKNSTFGTTKKSYASK